MHNFNLFIVTFVIFLLLLIFCRMTSEKQKYEVEKKTQKAKDIKKVGDVLTAPDLSEKTRHLLLEDELCGRDFTEAQQIVQRFGWQIIYASDRYPVHRKCLVVSTHPHCHKIRRIRQIYY